MNNLSFLTDEKINFIAPSPSAFGNKNLTTLNEQFRESVLKKYVSEKCLIKPLDNSDIDNAIWLSEKTGDVSLIFEKIFNFDKKRYCLEIFLCVKL